MYCVKCGQQSLEKYSEKSYRCQHCDFVYFHNVAAAACAVIVHNNKILLVKRGAEPGKGKLDFAGGFVDYNETGEQALRRELLEELQLPVEHLQYMFSLPNRYFYKDVQYHTLDAFFKIELDELPQLTLQTSEIEGYMWIKVEDIQLEEMAFVAGRAAVEALKAVAGR